MQRLLQRCETRQRIPRCSRRPFATECPESSLLGKRTLLVAPGLTTSNKKLEATILYIYIYICLFILLVKQPVPLHHVCRSRGSHLTCSPPRPKSQVIHSQVLHGSYPRNRLRHAQTNTDFARLAVCGWHLLAPGTSFLKSVSSISAFVSFFRPKGGSSTWNPCVRTAGFWLLVLEVGQIFPLSWAEAARTPIYIYILEAKGGGER